MITSRITSKARTTIPQRVRKALRLKDGDEIAYRIDSNRVIMTKASRPDANGPFGTFNEWAEEDDVRAYAEL